MQEYSALGIAFDRHCHKSSPRELDESRLVSSAVVFYALSSFFLVSLVSHPFGILFAALLVFPRRTLLQQIAAPGQIYRYTEQPSPPGFLFTHDEDFFARRRRKYSRPRQSVSRSIGRSIDRSIEINRTCSSVRAFSYGEINMEKEQCTAQETLPTMYGIMIAFLTCLVGYALWVSVVTRCNSFCS